MRLVKSADIRPHGCAVFPTLGTNHPKGYFDTGNELVGFDNHVYVSVEAVEQLAAQLGWVAPEAHAAVVEAVVGERDDATARADTAVEALGVAERELEAVDVLRNARWKQPAQRKPRVKAEQVEEVTV
jgi:hypothetical protein